jgi:hypothetical protein
MDKDTFQALLLLIVMLSGAYLLQNLGVVFRVIGRLFL